MKLGALAEAIEEAAALEWGPREFQKWVRIEQGAETFRVKLFQFFDAGESQLPIRYEAFVDHVARILERSGAAVEVIGYADLSEELSSSGYSSTWELSLARAKGVVKHWLERVPALAPRVVISAHGVNGPLSREKTPEGRALNRRLEWVIRPSRKGDQTSTSGAAVGAFFAGS